MPALCNGQDISVGKKTLVVQKELGSGSFGTVFKVYDNDQQEECALKIIKITGQINVQKILREIETLTAVDHERIIQILGVDRCQLSDGTYFLILTEFCAGGDLNSRLDKPSSVETNLKWISQLSEALSYLHSRSPPIVHRDLKADNVLLTDEITENLKLGDFGLARKYVALKNANGDSSDEAMCQYYMTSGTGPIHWMAPEFFARRYTEKADIFSLGGIFYAIYARDFIIGSKKMYGVFVSDPWQEKVGLGYAMAKIDKNAVVQFPSSFRGSTSVKRLIQDMLEYDPHDRPTASEVEQRIDEMI